MRRSLLLSLTSFTLCAEAPLSLEAPIQSVRVHPEEAWVTRIGNLHINNAGTHKLKFGQLPGDLTSDGIRVRTKGPQGTVLGGILVGPDRYSTPETPESKALLGKLENLHHRKAVLESQQKASEKASEYLDGAMSIPRNIGTGTASVSLPSGSALVELNRAVEVRWAELSMQAQTRNQEIETIDKEMKVLESEWQKLRGKLDTNPNPSQVMVEITTPRGGDFEIEFSYRTTQARWKPSYEARLASNGESMELVLFAEVTQTSGEPWDGVQLELSNSHPSRIQEMPVFTRFPWIGWQPPQPPIRGNATVEVVASMAQSSKTDDKVSANYSSALQLTQPTYRPPEPKSLPALEAPAASLEESRGMAQTWKLAGIKDVPTDGDTHRFVVASESLKTRLQITVAPRLSPTPYQMARFQAPSNIPMFPGAPILRSIGNMRMGQGNLAIPAPNREFELCFGPYQGLRVALQHVTAKRPFRMTKVTETRQYSKAGVKDLVKEEILANGNTRVWELRDRFLLTNDSETQLNIEVQDRSVRSNHESIEIKPTPDTTPGAVSPDPTFQVWMVQVAPKITREITSGLTITAPKEGDLTGLQDLGLE